MKTLLFHGDKQQYDDIPSDIYSKYLSVREIFDKYDTVEKLTVAILGQKKYWEYWDVAKTLDKICSECSVRFLKMDKSKYPVQMIFYSDNKYNPDPEYKIVVGLKFEPAICPECDTEAELILSEKRHGQDYYHCTKCNRKYDAWDKIEIIGG